MPCSCSTAKGRAAREGHVGHQCHALLTAPSGNSDKGFSALHVMQELRGCNPARQNRNLMPAAVLPLNGRLLP